MLDASIRPDPSYLRGRKGVDYDAITKFYDGKLEIIERRTMSPFLGALEKVRGIKASRLDFSGPKVTIGSADDVTPEKKESLHQALKALMPWRKGPYEICGIPIEAEWRSDLKWKRLEPHLPNLKGKRIADIGSNNGYYMFRMAAHDPSLVIGFDPIPRYYYMFKALNSIAAQENLKAELLGYEHLDHFREFFDVIFLMGILYHHPSPIEILRKAFRALKRNGTLVVETQGIPGKGPIALFPEKRYGKAPGVYFLPTEDCLINFVRRAAFKEEKLFYKHKMSPKEQRKTEWMVFESFGDYMDPENSDLTVEGYPAPMRFYLTAKKRG